MSEVSTQSTEIENIHRIIQDCWSHQKRNISPKQEHEDRLKTFTTKNLGSILNTNLKMIYLKPFYMSWEKNQLAF